MIWVESPYIADFRIKQRLDYYDAGRGPFLMEDPSSAPTPPVAAAPVNVVAPALSGAAYVGNTVSCSTGTWTGFPTPTYTYDWKTAGVSTGITTSTYTVQAADDTKALTCTVTATNASGSASATSNSLTVGTQPVVTVIPAISGTTEVGQTLTCSTGTWTGTATITYTYQWRANGSNIVGETASTLSLTSAQLGLNIDCRVTATNAYNSVASTANGVGPVTAGGGGTAGQAIGLLLTLTKAA